MLTAPDASVDLAPQSPGSPQRVEHAVPGRMLFGVVSRKQDTTCPKLGGAVELTIVPKDTALRILVARALCTYFNGTK